MGIRRLAFIASLLAAALPAPASASPDCASIPDDVDRLACYDRAWRAEGEGAPTWRVWQTVSPLDGAATLRASLAAQAPVADRFDRLVRPSLNLACRAGALAVWVHFGGAYMDPRAGGSRMTYRLDDSQPQTREFQLARDRRGLGAFTDRGARLFLAELDGARTLAVEATPFRTPTVTAVFDLRDLAEPLAQVRAACAD